MITRGTRLTPGWVGAAALLVAAAAPARGGAGEPLALRAEPQALLLGKGMRATIDIDAGIDTPPTVTASAGRVEDVRAVGPGRFVATYVPPADAYPQVAIVAAVAGGRAGWIALPLVGRGVAVARSRPRAAIRVTIGDASFGPVIASAKGEARIPVIAPPGVRFAMQGDQPLDLDIPPSVHVHLALERSEAAADAEHPLRVWVFAVSPDGTPRRSAPVDVSVSQGVLDDLVEIAPGTFAGTWRLPSGRAGEATATARLADEPGPAQTIGVARTPGKPARLTVESASRRIVAGQAEPIELHVRLEDAAGNAVEVVPRLEAALATVSPLRRIGPGAWEATYAVPREVGTARTSELVARAAGLEERLAIEVVPGEAARLVVEPIAPALVADGSAEALLRIQVLDRFGNRVADPAPEIVTTRPAAIRSERDGAGGWLVSYRPARAREDAVERLAVRAGGLESTARLDVIAPERRVAVAPKVGLAASRAGHRSAYLGVEATYRWPVLRGLGVALELGTFAHDRTDAVAAGATAIDVDGSARYVALLASARWSQKLGERVALWADAGAGGAHVATVVKAGNAPGVAESAVVTAVHGGLAAGLLVGHGAPFLEVRVARYGAPAVDRLQGTLSVFTFAIGYRHDVY